MVKNALRSLGRSVTTPQVLHALRRLVKPEGFARTTSHAVMPSWEAA